MGCLGQTKEAGSTTKDSGKRGGHTGDGANGPYLIEDEGHNDQREQDTDEAISGWGKLCRSGKARKDHQIIREGDLQPDIAEVTSSGDPGREQRDGSGEQDQRGDRVHVGKEEDSRAKRKNEPADEGAGEAKDKPLLCGSAGAETGDEHGRHSGGDAGPGDGLIDDVAEGGAEAELEGEGDGLGLAESAGNKQGNLAGGKGNELFVSGGSDFGGHCDDGVEHAIDAVEERGV